MEKRIEMLRTIYGKFDEDKEAFSNLTAEITKIFNEVLGIEPERIYVKYETTTNWGWNGRNF